jgi:hypothetical protein
MSLLHLLRRWSSWRLVCVVVAIHGPRRLHLSLGLLTTKVSSVLISIVAGSSALLSVRRRRVVLLIRSNCIYWLLRLYVRVVDSLAVAERRSPNPSSAVVWLLTGTPSAASAQKAKWLLISAVICHVVRRHT